MCEYAGKKVIVSTDYYNAFYVDGILVMEAKPDYLDTETLHNLFPSAEYYGGDWDFEDGFPGFLVDMDLEQFDRYV